MNDVGICNVTILKAVGWKPYILWSYTCKSKVCIFVTIFITNTEFLMFGIEIEKPLTNGGWLLDADKNRR